MPETLHQRLDGWRDRVRILWETRNLAPPDASVEAYDIAILWTNADIAWAEEYLREGETHE